MIDEPPAMLTVAAALLAITALQPHVPQTCSQAKPQEPAPSEAPAWAYLGLDARHRKTWLRIQREPGLYDGQPNPDGWNTRIELYGDGKLEKSKLTDVCTCFMGEIPITVVPTASEWFVFFDAHPGAGSTWYTICLQVRRSDLRFIGVRRFEHGDASKFQASHRFAEYKLLKYEGDRTHYDEGYMYHVIEWHFLGSKAGFRRTKQWYAADPPDRLGRFWFDPPDVQLRGTLVGTPDAFYPAAPSKYGLPEHAYFFVASNEPETVALIKEAQKHHGSEVTLAGLTIPIGDPDSHNPPHLMRTNAGLILTITTCAEHQVRVWRLLVTTKPYRMKVLGSTFKPEWTPFQHDEAKGQSPDRTGGQ